MGVTVQTQINSVELPPEVAGPLFRVTQEAVANAGKHAGASTITVRLLLRRRPRPLEIEDDGHGFGDVDPLGLSSRATSGWRACASGPRCWAAS